MKPSLLLALALFGSTVLAQEPFPEIGPHHRVWASVEEVLHPDGTWGWATNAVVQLEPGLHRWENGRWVETEAGLEIAGDVVIGQTTAHRVIWAANARSPGAVDLELPDGTRLVSQVLGLSYYDAATGQSVLIAWGRAGVHPGRGSRGEWRRWQRCRRPSAGNGPPKGGRCSSRRSSMRVCLRFWSSCPPRQRVHSASSNAASWPARSATSPFINQKS